MIILGRVRSKATSVVCIECFARPEEEEEGLYEPGLPFSLQQRCSVRCLEEESRGECEVHSQPSGNGGVGTSGQEKEGRTQSQQQTESSQLWRNKGNTSGTEPNTLAKPGG